MIKGKALFFAEKFNFSNFKASDSWMDKLKKGKEKNIYTVNKKFNLKVYFKVYSQLTFYRYFCQRECGSLCNHFMLV